jgi:CIC family chloride channel protein
VDASSITSEPKPAAAAADETNGLLTLAVLSLVTGVVAGLVGASFRLALDRADGLRNALIPRAHELHVAGFVLVVAVCAGATAVAAWLVRRYAPYASGSGIPHVEAVLNEELRPVPYILIPVKFIGGVLAIGVGLALGREGPSVQMGATLAHLVGRVFRRNAADCRVLLAAGAGAGLATAFNAPIAGAVFVLEELLRRFDTRVTIATFGASAGAIATGRVLLGQGADFQIKELPYPDFGTITFFLALGVLAGLLGIAYNRALLAALAGADRLRRIPAELRAALVGAAVGVIAWFAPALVGGGESLAQTALTGANTLALLAPVFVLRFVLGSVSYAAGTPGGLFAPLLALGAQSGLFFGILCSGWLRGAAPEPVSFAVVGMAAFFTGVVRSPVTGIILVIEMTSSFTLLLPMLGACFAAMLVPTLLRDPPIYDSLRERTLRVQERASAAADTRISK